MAQGNATAQEGRTGYLRLENEIGTYPAYIEQAATSVAFDATYPNVITVTGWPLSQAETMVVYGQSMWMFDAINGKLAFGKWSLSTGTLLFYATEGFSKWDTDVSGDTAKAIPNRDVKNFAQCSVQNISTFDVTVNGYTLSNQAQFINIVNEGNANQPIIIDASNSAIAQITTGLL